MSDETKHIIAAAKAQARKENIKNFFDKNAKEVKIAVTAILVFALLYSLYAAFSAHQKTKYSSILHQALIDQQSGNSEKANEDLKKIFEARFAPSDTKAVAGLRYSAILLSNNKTAEAIAIYEKIADCSSCNEYLRNLAALIAAKTIAISVEAEKTDAAIKQIAKLENSASVLKYQISEQRAILEMQKGNLKQAHEIFELISKSSEASPQLKERAQNFIDILASKGFVKQEQEAVKK